MKKQHQQSENYYQRATQVIPGGVNSPVRAFKQVGGKPLFFKKASGSGFEDEDGNRYVDYCQSWGPLILGHAHPDVIGAVNKAAEAGLSYGACHRGEVELAELILESVPGFNRIRFMNSGTEAVMAAVRLARAATGRNLIVKFDGGYHGHFDGMLVKAGSGLATHAIASSEGIPAETAQTTLVAPLDDEDAVQQLFDQHGGEIAAVIVEPLPANNGLLVQRKEFLQFLRTVSRDNNALLIFDEVITGFRLHYGMYWQLLDIAPDLFTLGKIIGGGMPVGALVGTQEIMDMMSPLGNVYQAGTLSGNPVSLAAGKATIRFLKTHSPYQKMEELGAHFVDTLESSSSPQARAQRVGSLIWLYLSDGDFPRRSDQISQAAMDRFTRLYWKLLRKGHYLPPSSFEVLFLSALHSREEVTSLAEDIIKEL